MQLLEDLIIARITLARAFVLRGFFRKTVTELDREIKAENLIAEVDKNVLLSKDEHSEKTGTTKLDRLIELYLKAQGYLE